MECDLELKPKVLECYDAYPRRSRSGYLVILKFVCCRPAVHPNFESIDLNFESIELQKTNMQDECNTQKKMVVFVSGLQ